MLFTMFAPMTCFVLKPASQKLTSRICISATAGTVYSYTVPAILNVIFEPNFRMEDRPAPLFFCAGHPDTLFGRPVMVFQKLRSNSMSLFTAPCMIS